MYKNFFKRVFDIIISFILILVLLPVLIIISILVKVDSKGPVFFKQDRIGKNGKIFKIIKFRSMKVNSEHTGSGVYSGKNDNRLTKVGKFIRATSIDELPQLFNILVGEMSLIGPRAPLTYHPWTFDKYTEEQKKMFNVLPGITGWAQVNGRKEVEWHKRIELNVWYVEHLSFLLDVKILFKTFFKVFSNADNENVGETVRKDLKLMYITNKPNIAKIAEEAGVNRIFVDLEFIGKSDRQGGMDTVQSHHTLEDVALIRKTVNSAEILVRVNPIHEKTDNYLSSKEEIDIAIKNGADVIMLPYFKTAKEVKTFVDLVGGRAKTIPLIETPEAVSCIDEILKIDGIDELYIGLNDLSLGYGQKFMFEPLANGTVDDLVGKIKKYNIPFGFGGIASLGKGDVPAEMVIAEHYRLGSSMAILSRSFCNSEKLDDSEIEKIFSSGIKEIRDFEKKCTDGSVDLKINRENFCDAVNKVVGLKK